MPSQSLIILLSTLLSMSAIAQQLSAPDKKLAVSARTRYYNLEAAGLESFTCSVKFDISTVPLLSSTGDSSTRQLVEKTTFVLALDKKGPSVQHHYPADVTQASQQQASQTIGLLTSLVSGLFQTWLSKGFQGPIPPFDSQIESIISIDNGYIFNLRVPGAPVQVFTNKDYLVTEIVSVGGKLHEKPTYVSSPDGLILVENQGTDSEQANPVEIKYELEPTLVDGLRLPGSAHLRVNDNIDLKFALRECRVRKATVIKVGPPAS
jgi:hypothetical protein